VNFGFENDKWYIDITSCNRPIGTIREEHNFRARSIAETSKNIMLSFSGGTDSQVMLLSFLQQSIPVETVFMYLPGYNDHEYKQVQEINSKWGITTQVIDFDPYEFKEEFEEESLKYDIQIYSIIQKHFYKLIPDNYDFISNIHDPYIHMDQHNNPFYFTGYNSYECVRHRAFSLVERLGKFIFWGDTSEMLASILTDDIVASCNHAWRYIRGNGLTKPNSQNVYVHSIDKWDYFIKPFLYGKHWRDEIIYFPKSQGFEKIEFANTYYPMFKHGVMIPFNELTDFLTSMPNTTKRFYENVSTEPINS